MLSDFSNTSPYKFPTCQCPESLQFPRQSLELPEHSQVWKENKILRDMEVPSLKSHMYSAHLLIHHLTIESVELTDFICLYVCMCVCAWGWWMIWEFDSWIFTLHWALNKVLRTCSEGLKNWLFDSWVSSFTAFAWVKCANDIKPLERYPSPTESLANVCSLLFLRK